MLFDQKKNLNGFTMFSPSHQQPRTRKPRARNRASLRVFGQQVLMERQSRRGAPLAEKIRSQELWINFKDVPDATRNTRKQLTTQAGETPVKCTYTQVAISLE